MKEINTLWLNQILTYDEIWIETKNNSNNLVQ